MSPREKFDLLVTLMGYFSFGVVMGLFTLVLFLKDRARVQWCILFCLGVILGLTIFEWGFFQLETK